MAQVNRVMAIGTVVRPVVLRRVKENLAVADLAIRLANSYTDRAGKHVVKDFTLELVAFGQAAERCADIVEGAQVLIQGRLKMEPRVAPDGAKINTYNVICDRIDALTAEEREAQRRTTPEPAPGAEPAAPAPEAPAPSEPEPAPEPARGPSRRRVRPASKPSGALEEVAAAVA